MFNAIKYTEELEKAGFTQEQAKASLKLIIEVMNENFATKSDLKELGLKLESRMIGVESKIHSLELKTESGFKELEYKLTIKLATILGAMMTLTIGLTATVVKLLPSIGQ